MARKDAEANGGGTPDRGDEGERDRLARARMVDIIAAEVAETGRWLGKDRLDDRVLAALGQVPRHAFVPPSHRSEAYENRPLPIGHGQTISQPYIVAIMTDLAGTRPGCKVLEVGTGCGYQAAILAAAGAQVWTIETVQDLAEQAARRLAELGFDGVRVRHGDGSRGWPEEAPFDAILVTAAASGGTPQALIDQLAPGGRLVIPVERRAAKLSLFGRGSDQELVVIVKGRDGSLTESCHLPVAFVPLIEGGRP